jgi:hypothetical protein
LLGYTLCGLNIEEFRVARVFISQTVQQGLAASDVAGSFEETKQQNLGRRAANRKHEMGEQGD